jgi:hypothetical protein
MENQVASTQDVKMEITDEQVDKFFQNGGQEDVSEVKEDIKSDQKEVTKEESQNKESEEKADTPEKQFEKNYKAAMHEERERRKELQKRIDEINQRNATLEQNFQRVMEKIYQQQQPQVKEPTFEEDPINALNYEQQRIKEFLRRQYQEEERQRQLIQYQSQQQALVNRYHNDAYSFMAKDAPDFKEAYQYLVQNRLQEYKEAGYTDAQAQQLLVDDEFAITVKAYEDGANPAERMYKLAKLRGYKATPANVTQEQKAPEIKNLEQKLDQLEKGVNASKSLSNVGGKSEKGLSLEEISHMSDDELDELMKDQKAWKKLGKLMG